MQLVFTDTAIQDINDISDWYEQQRVGLSYDFELCLEAAINEIARYPLAFQKKYRNVSVIYIQRFPYGIHFIAHTDIITIIAVFHTSRSPRKWHIRK